MSTDWRLYEATARLVLKHLSDALGVSEVGGEKVVDGNSGTQWRLDATALVDEGENFLIVEVRRHATRSLNQEDIAAIAYRIDDTNASGGIVVTPLPLQRGAKLVAKKAGIEHVQLTADSTAVSYLAEYMGRRFFGASIVESVNATDSADAEVIRGSK